MLGSTFIATNNPEDLTNLEIDNLDSFQHVSLEELITLDFELALQGSGTKWVQGKPIIFKEEAGIAIFQINPAGLHAVLEQNSQLSISHTDEISTLRNFIKDAGAVNIYEVATF